MDASASFFIPKCHEISTLPWNLLWFLSMVLLSKNWMSDYIRYIRLYQIYQGEKISLALLALTCVLHAAQGQPAQVVFREEKHASLTSCQLSLCASRVTTPSLWKPFSQSISLWCYLSSTSSSSPPPPSFSFSKSEVYAKSSPKVICSLSIDYLIWKHRTPRRSWEQRRGPWIRLVDFTNCFLRLQSLPPRRSHLVSASLPTLGSSGRWDLVPDLGGVDACSCSITNSQPVFK